MGKQRFVAHCFAADGEQEIEREFPLDHLRRWSHTETTFTLDFGTYEDDYVTCYTSEGEAINNLISGYIDLIMKRLQSMRPLARSLLRTDYQCRPGCCWSCRRRAIRNR